MDLPGPHDLLIAVMGVTGSGKSTFISHFCAEATVGHGLESHTSQVGVFRYRRQDGTSIYFVDTPGFDDTFKKDTDILREIAAFLNKTYERQTLLSGIIYLHRISDPRLGGSGMKNLRMFKKLVGEDGLANVVLATTMWSFLPNIDAGYRREVELTQRDNFWGHMISNGSRVFRQDRGVESAKEIVEHIIGRQSFVALDIQRDMIDRNLPLDETAAGQEVQAELDKERAEHERRIREMREEMREAIAERDQEHQEEIRQQKAEIEKKMRANDEAINRLKASKEEIRSEMEAKWQQERQQIIEQYERRHERERAEQRQRQERLEQEQRDRELYYERERAEQRQRQERLEQDQRDRELYYERERAEQRQRQERLEQEQRDREMHYQRELTEQRERQERLEQSLREQQEQREQQALQRRRTPTPESSSDSSPSPPPRRSPSSSPISSISSPSVSTYYYSRPVAPPPLPIIPFIPPQPAYGFVPPPPAFGFVPPPPRFTSFYVPCQCGYCTGYGTSPCPYC
ncbi:P-loop containing nucleoside triphosphate hydrolase protein [Xylaria scruposa]|nr:P-loop containing nucleoside triphosphate hydrolase protein [Xylaria scruposa]